MLENPFYHEADQRMARCVIRRWITWALIAALVIVVMVLAAAKTVAAPLAAAMVEGGVKITLYSDPCTLTAEVINLPRRATWTEGEKSFEGCFAVTGNAVLIYFSDKTVVVVPAQMFMGVARMET